MFRDPTKGLWVLPTMGRPEQLRDVLEACVRTGMSTPGLVVLNGAEQRARYEPVLLEAGWVTGGTHALAEHARRLVPPNWDLVVMPDNLGFNGACQMAFLRHPEAEWFGCMADDAIPQTPGWDLELLSSLSPQVRIVSANDLWQTQSEDVTKSRLSPTSVFDAELLRTMGFWFMPGLWSLYADDVIEGIGRTFGCWKVRTDVIAPHRHFMNRQAPRDRTYDASYGNPERAEADKAAYNAWTFSDARREMNERLSKLLGGDITQFDPRGIRLAVCIPCGTARPVLDFMLSLDALRELCQQWGMPMTVHWSAGASHIGKARERLLWDAYGKGATHILFIDDDMGFDAGLATRLIAGGYPFSAIIGVRKQEELSVCCNFLFNDQKQMAFDRHGWLEVDKVGFAFTMLKREAIDRLVEAYPDLAYDAGPAGECICQAPPAKGPFHTAECPAGQRKTEHALFLDVIEVDAEGRPQRLSEDFSFSARWRAIGGEIWIDPHAGLAHWGRKAYTGRPADLFVRVPSEPTAVAAE